MNQPTIEEIEHALLILERAGCMTIIALGTVDEHRVYIEDGRPVIDVTIDGARIVGAMLELAAQEWSAHAA